MIISTVNINKNYDVIDTIFNLYIAKPKGFLGSDGINLETAFNSAKAELVAKARERGGNAVIGCQFQVRAATAGMADTQVLEIYCFGTVVNIPE